MVKVLTILLDPAIFNYVILSLYLLSALRWTVSRDYNSAIYWLGAFIITSAVTWRVSN